MGRKKIRLLSYLVNNYFFLIFWKKKFFFYFFFLFDYYNLFSNIFLYKCIYVFNILKMVKKGKKTIIYTQSQIKKLNENLYVNLKRKTFFVFYLTIVLTNFIYL